MGLGSGQKEYTGKPGCSIDSSGVAARFHDHESQEKAG